MYTCSLFGCDDCAMPDSAPLMVKTIVKIAIGLQCVDMVPPSFEPPTRICLPFAFDTHGSRPASLSDNVATPSRCASTAPAAVTLS
jgi:hypothetical protein